MRFAQRCAVLLFLTILNISLWLTAPLLYSHSNHPAPLVPITGLHVDPWKVRSLQGMGEKHRAHFGKLYDDDRRFFGDGNGNYKLLTDKTQPYKNKFLGEEDEEILQNDEVRNIVKKMVGDSEVLRRMENLDRLLIAADQIKKQVNVSSLTFKSVLQVKKGVMGNVKRIEDYGRSFQLTRSEKLALMSAVPHKKEEAETNKASKELPADFVLTRAAVVNLTRTWSTFYTRVSRWQLYKEGPAINRLLQDLTTLPVTKLHLYGTRSFNPAFDAGTRRLRPHLNLAGGGKALFSPIMSSRTQETVPNHLPRDDVYRHTSEIAAFHLDRALGFHRASPCVGRTFSLSKDLIPMSSEIFQKYNVHTSLEGNLCIQGPNCKKCQLYEAGSVCGKPDLIEGSMLLDTSILNVRSLPYPWGRTQELNAQDAWHHTDFCGHLRVIDPYYQGRRLLDFVDLAVFDFLQGNMDRTEYQLFEKFEKDTFILHNNNSRGFGQAYHDEMTILAPLYQCCTIRYSTFQTLLGFELGPNRLSEQMTDSLLNDPLAPILLDQHLLALDRRVSITLKLVYECIKASKSTNVIIDDGF